MFRLGWEPQVDKVHTGATEPQVEKSTQGHKRPLTLGDAVCCLFQQ